MPAAFSRAERGEVCIGGSGHHHVPPAGVQMIPDAQGDGEVDLFLESSAGSAGTAIDTAVAGVNHHHRPGDAEEARQQTGRGESPGQQGNE